MPRCVTSQRSKKTRREMKQLEVSMRGYSCSMYPCIVSIGIAFCFTGGRCSAIDVTSQREADSLERCNVPPANGWRTTVCENIEACRMTHDARHSAIDPCGKATLGRSRSLVNLPEQRMRVPVGRTAAALHLELTRATRHTAQCL